MKRAARNILNWGVMAAMVITIGVSAIAFIAAAIIVFAISRIVGESIYEIV